MIRITRWISSTRDYTPAQAAGLYVIDIEKALDGIECLPGGSLGESVDTLEECLNRLNKLVSMARADQCNILI